MDGEALRHYLGDGARRGPAPAGAHSGSAGGAPCGDLVRISLLASDGRIASVSQDAEGCAASRAAAAAAAELVDGLPVLSAAKVGTGEIAAALGGLGATHRHACDLAADALHRALSALAGSGEPVASAPAAARERVLVALSGGVDSAVAALLERDRGAAVVAVTLKLWADPATDGERSCCSPEAVLRARRLAHSLGVPHLTLDLQPEFRAGVVQPFLDGYAGGRTPNPCVLCNGEVRLDAMIALADRAGAGSLATGHYARLRDDGQGPLLAGAADAAKDQTYMLAGLRPSSLSRMRFPLAELTKAEVRAIAAERDLEVAGRAESQDLCFLAGQGKRAFLRRHAGLGERPGRIVAAGGEAVGSHPGFHEYTVGQRRGLGLGGGEPRYVLATDARENTVTVGPREALETDEIHVSAVRMHRDASRVDGVRLRYHAPVRGCSLSVEGGGEATIRLRRPTGRVAPGQLACLLDGDLVVGHGTIA